MDYETIKIETHGRVALLRLDRPRALNALNARLIGEVADALTHFEADPGIGCVVLTGSAEAFAAGADIKELRDKTVAEAYLDDFLSRWDGVARARKPVIAAVAGYALGGGCELAMMCDLILAADTARFGQPEINLGIIPGWGGTQRLARATNIGYAKELILTGRMVDSAEALERGLVQHVYAPEELMAKTMELAQSMAVKSPVALYYAKETTNRSLHGDIGGNLVHEADLYSLMFSTQDAAEGLRAFVEKREPTFVGR